MKMRQIEPSEPRPRDKRRLGTKLMCEQEIQCVRGGEINRSCLLVDRDCEILSTYIPGR